MKIEMNYINSITIERPVEIKIKDSDKTFYVNKIIIKGEQDIITMMLKSKTEIIYNMFPKNKTDVVKKDVELINKKKEK